MGNKKFVFVLYSVWCDCNTRDKGIRFYGAFSSFKKAKLFRAELERLSVFEYFEIRRIPIF